MDEAPGKPAGSAGRRTGLVIIDQGMSSVSNILVIIFVAHALAPEDFGRFALLFLVAGFAQGLVRTLVSLTVLVHPEVADGRPRAVIGSALILGAFAGLVCLVGGAIAWWAGSPLGPATVALSLFLPLLLLHDLGRYLGFATARAMRSILIDTLWVAFMVVFFAVTLVRGDASLLVLIAGWAGSGSLAALWVFVQYGVPRGEQISLAWLRERWHFSWRTFVGNMSGNGGALIGAMLITTVSGPLSVAAVRASLLLGRPGAAVQLAAGASAAADVAREKPDDRELRRHQRRAMTISAAAALVNVVVLLALPDAVGRLILGGVWPIIEPLLLPAGLAVVALAAQSGVRAALLGRREVHIAMIVDIVGTLLTISGLVVGAALWDQAGAVWGLVAGQAVTSAVWWAVFLRYLRRRAREHEFVHTGLGAA